MTNNNTPMTPALDLVNIALRRSGQWILRDITWSIPQGVCAAILGPNGSGKSTLARILACHLWPTVGEASILGFQFGQADLRDLRHAIRLVQSAGPYDIDPELCASDAVLTGFFGTIGLYDPVTDAMRQSADRLLRQVGLWSVADHPYHTLSSGEKVRALIARALAVQPRLLLLDEPTAGLDLLAREQVLATIQALFDTPHAHSAGSSSPPPPTVILITHHVEELPPATSHILLLASGRCAAAGPPDQVLTAPILSAVYRCPVEVTHHHGRYSLHVHPRAWTGLLDHRDARRRLGNGPDGG